MRFFAVIAAIALLAVAPATADEPRTLTVYTYGSFVSEWGPGPAIEQSFEVQCDCDLVWVAAEDAAALLSRLRLEGEATDADVVLGLDTSLTAAAVETGLFVPHEIAIPAFTWTESWDDPYFVPFDYGYFAFVYDSERILTPPQSLDALIAGDPAEKIVIQDPRTSTPGLGLLLWMRHVYGDEAPAKWRQLNERILTVTSGWSEAYGLFLDGEAPIVLSYTTSPAYHINAESETRYKAAIFPEGHYMQVEVAGRTIVADDPALASEFLTFVLSDGFQNHVPTGNWMYPVIALPDPLPEGFEDVVSAGGKALLFPSETVAGKRGKWIDEWLRALSD